MEKFVVSSAPFVHSKNDINKMFLFTAIALVLPAIFSVLYFGLDSLIIIAVSLLTCFLSECLYNLINLKKFKVDNFSFFVTGLVLALTMPHKVPFYIVIACGFFSIFIVKFALGGLGINKFNPANTGRCFAGIISAGLSGEFYKVIINGEELTSLTDGGTNTLTNLFSGQAVGGIGTTCIIVLLICLVFLIYTKVIDYKIPIISILSYFVVQVILMGLEPAMMSMLSGSFLFACIFIMTDPNTSPNTLPGKIVYSILFGALSALLWKLGPLGENTVFVVALFVNMLVPFMDKYFIWKPLNFGGYRNAHKK